MSTANQPDDDAFDDREFVLRMIDEMLRRESLAEPLRERILGLRREVSRMSAPPRTPALH